MLLRHITRRRPGASPSHASPSGAFRHLLAVVALCACSSDGESRTTVEPLPAGTIALSLTPGSVTLTPGGVGGVGLSVTRGGSFAGPVTLAASGVPAGVSLTFGSSTVSSGAVSTSVNLTVANGAAPGTTEVSITGSGGGITSPVAKLTVRIQ